MWLLLSGNSQITNKCKIKVSFFHLKVILQKGLDLFYESLYNLDGIETDMLWEIDSKHHGNEENIDVKDVSEDFE